MAAQGSGVLLLVAIQHFDAGPVSKALLSGATFAGLLLGPLVVNATARRQASVPRAIALLTACAAAALAFAAVLPSYAPFLLGVMVGVPLLQSCTPLVTAIWQRNVPAATRGRWFGLISSAAGVAGILSGLAIAAWLGDDAGRYRPAILVLALLVAGGALAALRIPGYRLERAGRNPLASLSLLWRHPLFGFLSVAWMMLGFGNLATVPLRTEYVASGDYGFAYPASVVLVLTVVLPQAAALVAAPVWGRVFDRIDFLQLRIGINLTFASSILLFFGPALWMQVVGGLLFGAAQGGGLVAWNLWVTKYAPPGRTADYMGVHTFLTGIRGIVAPMLAYYALGSLPLLTVTRLGVGLILVASGLIAGLMLWERRGGRGSGGGAAAGG